MSSWLDSRAPPVDALTKEVREAEARFIAAQPGSVPPHLDPGGHLPFGGSLGGTDGTSLFGKRKIVVGGSYIPNPRALMLNYPPEPTEANMACWRRNYQSNIFLDPKSAFGLPAKEHFTTSTFNSFGKPVEAHSSYLAEANRSYGNPRATKSTRPVPKPCYDPPSAARADDVPENLCQYTWQWPERKKRPPLPGLEKPPKVEQNFATEYELRPPWLKY